MSYSTDTSSASASAAPSASHAGRRLIIIPAFNEQASIGQVVADLRQHVPDCDVVVVDDGSTDATGDIAERAGARVLRLPFNQGIGGAMQTGYRFAKRYDYDVAVQVDADGQHLASEVKKLMDELSQSDAHLAVGSRFLGQRSYMPRASRMLGIHFLRTLIRVLGGQSLTDITSGFRAAGRHAIYAFAYWYPEDYPEPEVVLLLRRAGYTVRETPVAMGPRLTGTSSIPFLTGMFYVLKVSAALLLDLFRNPWPKDKVTPP